VSPIPRQRTNHVRDTRSDPGTSHSAWCGSGRGRPCRGRRSPAASAACFRTVWRWEQGLGKRNAQHMMALLKLAAGHGLGHPFTG